MIQAPCNGGPLRVPGPALLQVSHWSSWNCPDSAPSRQAGGITGLAQAVRCGTLRSAPAGRKKTGSREPGGAAWPGISCWARSKLA